MTSIKIDNLPPAGSDLFSDPESFMTDLSESEFGQELQSVKGGLTVSLTVSLTTAEVTGAHPTSIYTTPFPGISAAHPTSIARKTIYSI